MCHCGPHRIVAIHGPPLLWPLFLLPLSFFLSLLPPDPEGRHVQLQPLLLPPRLLLPHSLRMSIQHVGVQVQRVAEHHEARRQALGLLAEVVLLPEVPLQVGVVAVVAACGNDGCPLLVGVYMIDPFPLWVRPSVHAYWMKRMEKKREESVRVLDAAVPLANGAGPVLLP